MGGQGATARGMKRHNAQLCLVPAEGADAAVHNLVDAVREGDHSCGWLGVHGIMRHDVLASSTSPIRPSITPGIEIGETLPALASGSGLVMELG